MSRVMRVARANALPGRLVFQVILEDVEQVIKAGVRF